MSKWAMDLYRKLDPEGYERTFGKKKRNKYGAERTGEGAQGYHSKLEERIGSDLYLREAAGELSDIRRQVTVVLQEGGAKVRIAVKIDFVAFHNRKKRDIAIEAKGLPTERWRLILKLWRVVKPMDLEIWGGTHEKPRLLEVIG